MAVRKRRTKQGRAQAHSTKARRKRAPRRSRVVAAPPTRATMSDPQAALGGVVSLSDFLGTAAPLTQHEREQLVDQALVLIDQVYVHLPLKRAMHAVDPVQRLKLVRFRVGEMSERHFHDELISIFTELRDLHTNYILPQPYQSGTAFLPFLIEEYFAGGTRTYMVSKVFEGFTDANFIPGVLIDHWNGIPIERAVELNAQRQAGSNPAARHARGLEAMTIRPLLLSAPPDEEWADIGFASADGGAHEIRIPWQVFQPDPSPQGVDPTSESPHARALGIDAQTEAVRRAKKALFARPAMETERRAVNVRKAGGNGRGIGDDTTSSLPDVFSFRTVTTPHGTFGYLRIWTFDVDDPDVFVNEFIRIAGLLPQNGLILDVRGNGGGLITAGERLLQLLTPRAITPEPLHFINTPLTLRLCRAASDLEPWVVSIGESVETGTQFSLGFPIDSVEECNRIGQRYVGPVVLVTDALIYSTTDIFTAGFQDHHIGTIVGTSPNMGAGGANVWELGLLQQLLPGANSPFKPMPKGASFRVAIRRTMRVNDHAGVPVEDLGVIPDIVHKMTRNDLLQDNVDLIARAGKVLASAPAPALSAKATLANGTITVDVVSKNIDRIDFLVDDRPRLSLDVGSNGSTSADVPGGPGVQFVDVRGFKNKTLAAVRRLEL